MEKLSGAERGTRGGFPNLWGPRPPAAATSVAALETGAEPNKQRHPAAKTSRRRHQAAKLCLARPSFLSPLPCGALPRSPAGTGMQTRTGVPLELFGSPKTPAWALCHERHRAQLVQPLVGTGQSPAGTGKHHGYQADPLWAPGNAPRAPGSPFMGTGKNPPWAPGSPLLVPGSPCGHRAVPFGHRAAPCGHRAAPSWAPRNAPQTPGSSCGHRAAPVGTEQPLVGTGQRPFPPGGFHDQGSKPNPLPRHGTAERGHHRGHRAPPGAPGTPGSTPEPRGTAERSPQRRPAQPMLPEPPGSSQ